jgi:uncharacterized protein (DUF849 family)
MPHGLDMTVLLLNRLISLIGAKCLRAMAVSSVTTKAEIAACEQIASWVVSLLEMFEIFPQSMVIRKVLGVLRVPNEHTRIFQMFFITGMLISNVIWKLLFSEG